MKTATSKPIRFGKNTELFLRESNAIEGVYDEDSYLQAKYAWEYLITQDELTPGVVTRTHKILMLHQRLRPDERGYVRRCDVQVGGQIKLSWKAVPQALAQWCEEVKIDILGMRRLWKQRHIEYEDIHPFVDGNGRTGRMFMNWQRLKQGLPLLIIEESKKYSYYDWFK